MSERPEDQQERVELLDQSEIDRLMNESQKGPEVSVYRHDGSRFESSESVFVDIFDFRNPVFLTEIELRQVRIRHEKFIHYLAARLSMFLRMDFGLKMSKLYTTPYRKFTENIPSPTYISLFRIEQLSGVGILDINPRLAMTMVDRMLGGPGHSVRDERYLTEIEIALLEEAILTMLEEWCRQWEDIQEMHAAITGRENSGRFLQTSPHDAIVLVLTMEATLGDCSEPLQIGIPYYTIEPVIKHMQENARKHNEPNPNAEKPRWRNPFDNINVPIYAVWDAFDIPMRDLVSLRAGDVLELPQDVIGETRLLLENTPRFIGEAGLDGTHVAIKVTQSLDDDNLN